MTRLDTITRLALIVASVAVSIWAATGTVANLSRTTTAGPGIVYRENVISGGGEFCSPHGCYKSAPRFDPSKPYTVEPA